MIRYIEYENKKIFAFNDIVKALGYIEDGKKSSFAAIARQTAKRVLPDNMIIIKSIDAIRLLGEEIIDKARSVYITANDRYPHQVGYKFITIAGVLQLIEKREGYEKEKQDLIDYIYGEILVDEEKPTLISNKRFETDFKATLEELCNVFGYSFNYQYNVDKYRLDFYFKDQNLVVEYDERQHSYTDNKVLDKEREDYIKNKLHCRVLRLNYKDSHVKNAGLIIKTLQEEVKVEEPIKPRKVIRNVKVNRK